MGAETMAKSQWTTVAPPSIDGKYSPSIVGMPLSEALMHCVNGPVTVTWSTGGCRDCGEQ